MDKRTAGYIAKKNGAEFEALIERSLAEYKAAGLACISKTPEPMRVLRSAGNGRFVCCFQKKAEPDFKGVLMNGQCIIFDAKHTEKEKISQSAISSEQWDVFDSYERMKALCYVVVSIKFERFYRVPWATWKRMKEIYGHKHMTLDDLDEFRVFEKLTKTGSWTGGNIMMLDGIRLR